MGDGRSSTDDGKLDIVLAMGKRYEPGQIVNTEDGNNGDKQLALVSGVDQTSQDKDPKRQKKNPLRRAEEKAFNRHYHPAPRDEPKDTAVVGNITKLLPANTFLMFQTLAPLATNQGNCYSAEKLMTSLMIMILASTCMMVCFTDTFQFNGKVYHGIVTWSGLWNPSFKGDPAFNDLRQYEHKLAKFYEERKRYKIDKKDPNRTSKPVRPEEPLKPTGPRVMGPIYHSGTKQFCLKFTDFLHAVLSAAAFATFTLLTAPVSTCFYPHISTAIVKTTPLLVGFVVSAIFAFSPPARNGIAHPLPPGKITTPAKPASPDPNGKDGDATTTSGAQPPGGPDPKGFLGQLESKVIGSTFVQKALKQAEEKLSNVNLPPGVDALVEMGEGDLHEIGSQATTAATSSVPAAKDAAPQDLEIFDPLMPQANKFFSLAAHEANTLYQPAADAINSAQLSAQLSGLPQTLRNSLGTEASTLGAHALAAGQAWAREGFQLPGSPSQYLSEQLLKQHAILGSQGLINKNLIQANTLARDGSALYEQGVQSSHDIQNRFLQQESAVAQGLNAQLQTMKQPAISVAHGVASIISQGSHLLSGVPSLVAQAATGQLAPTVAREVGTLLVEGADHGVVGVTTEVWRQKDVLAQELQKSIQPVTSLIEGVKSLEQQGYQSIKGSEDELLKSNSALQQEVNTELQALRQPSTSLAQDFTSMFQQGSQNSNGVQFDKITVQKAAGLGTQFIDAVARNALQQGVDQTFRRGMNEVQDQLSRPQAALNYQYQTLYQPASSVAIDIPSLAQQGSRAFNDVRSQLQQQESATTQGLNAQFQNLYQPASSVANDALSVYQQNMDGARSLATGLIQDPQTLQRQMSVLTQGPVAQFQHTVDQIHTYQPITDQSLVGSRPVQQLSTASAQEAGPSGMLTRASQSLSSFADSTGATTEDVSDAVARTRKYAEGFKEGVDNVVLSAQTAKLPTGAEFKGVQDVSSTTVPESRESSTQLAERVLRGVLANTSEAADRQAEKGKSQISDSS